MRNSPKIKIILINGAPGSGKDTLASLMKPAMDSILTEDMDVHILPMKLSLVDQVQKYFNIPKEVWDKRYEPYKETSWDLLYGMSPRQALIWMSEEVTKPKFGADFYGKEHCNFIKKCTQKDSIILIPDSGFVEEVFHLCESFGKDNCVMVNVYREGTDFSKDSRYLITGEMVDIKGYDVRNNRTVEDLKKKVNTICEIILEDLNVV